MSFDEPALRIKAAVDLLEHAIAEDADRLDLIHHARRLLAAAEALLRREAA